MGQLRSEWGGSPHGLFYPCAWWAPGVAQNPACGGVVGLSGPGRARAPEQIQAKLFFDWKPWFFGWIFFWCHVYFDELCIVAKFGKTCQICLHMSLKVCFWKICLRACTQPLRAFIIIWHTTDRFGSVFGAYLTKLAKYEPQIIKKFVFWKYVRRPGHSH